MWPCRTPLFAGVSLPQPIVCRLAVWSRGRRRKRNISNININDSLCQKRLWCTLLRLLERESVWKSVAAPKEAVLWQENAQLCVHGAARTSALAYTCPCRHDRTATKQRTPAASGCCCWSACRLSVGQRERTAISLPPSPPPPNQSTPHCGLREGLVHIRWSAAAETNRVIVFSCRHFGWKNASKKWIKSAKEFKNR